MERKTERPIDKTGERIRQGRISIGIAQNELAERVHTSANNLCDIEKGRTLPGSELLLLLSNELHCTPNDLLGIENPSVSLTGDPEETLQFLQYLLQQENLEEIQIIIKRKRK